MARLLLVSLLTILVTSPAQAEVIFSNLGVGDTFNTASSYWITGPAHTAGNPPAIVGNLDVAAVFSINQSQNFRLGTVELALAHNGGANFLNVRLLNDDAGLPGNELASTSVSGIADSPSLVTANFSGAGITLNAGSSYWLAAHAEADASFLWNLNATGQEGYGFKSTDVWDVRIEQHPTAAFRVNGSSVPEPSVLLLGGLAFLYFAGVVRHKSINALARETCR